MSNRSIWPIDRTLSDAITQGQIELLELLEIEMFDHLIVCKQMICVKFNC